jgi:hypothetical protein
MRRGGLPSDSNTNGASCSEQFSPRTVGVGKLHIKRHASRNLSAKEIFMTSKKKAELLFKQEQLSGGRSSIPEYEQRALAERTKTAKLRELRLAREAELTPKPEETRGASEKPTQQRSSKTLRPQGPIR